MAKGGVGWEYILISFEQLYPIDQPFAKQSFFHDFVFDIYF